MNKSCLLFALLFSFSCCYTQQLSQVTFSQASAFSWFTISTNQNILIRIAADGKMLEYGTEQASVYNRNYFAPNLIPFSGAVGYYQNQPDSILNGKIKNIGACYFTYYGSHDYPERSGKIKSAGSLLFDYYRSYEDALNAGKIKSISNMQISYYSSYDNEAFKGQPKSVGNTSITYYSSFETPSLKGKLKTIGAYRLDWGSTASSSGFIYYLKTGNQRQLLNGITYILE